MDSLSAPEPHGISTQGGSHSCRAHSCTCACVYTYSFTKIRCALPCPNYFCVPRLQAYMRRAAAHKELDDLDHALGDAKKVCVHKKGTHVFSTLGPVICLPTAKQSLSHPCRIAEAHRERVIEAHCSAQVFRTVAMGRWFLIPFGLVLQRVFCISHSNSGHSHSHCSLT